MPYLYVKTILGAWRYHFASRGHELFPGRGWDMCKGNYIEHRTGSLLFGNRRVVYGCGNGEEVQRQLRLLKTDPYLIWKCQNFRVPPSIALGRKGMPVSIDWLPTHYRMWIYSPFESTRVTKSSSYLKSMLRISTCYLTSLIGCRFKTTLRRRKYKSRMWCLFDRVLLKSYSPCVAEIISPRSWRILLSSIKFYQFDVGSIYGVTTFLC